MKTAFLTACLVLPLVAAAAPLAAQQAVASDAGPVVSRVTLAPLRIELDGTEQYDTMRVLNPSSRPVGVQVRAFGWSQEDGEDVYEPTNEVMVSPAIIVIEPGETQIFRVMRRPLPAAGERRYRIAVDQLPDPALEKAGQAMTRIRFTIPMFVDREISSPASLAWFIEGNELRVANSGQQTVRMVNLSLNDSSGLELPVDGVSLHYVHGDSWMAWNLPDGCPTSPVTVSASIDGEPFDAQVSVDCP